MYHLQNIEDVQMVRLKKMVVLDTSKYIGIFSMDSFRYDQDLEIEKAACRRIPCVYLTFLKMLKQKM